MSSWKEIEELGHHQIKKLGRHVQEYLSMSGDERLLRERRKRRNGYRDHLTAYLVVNLALWLFFAVVAGVLIPAFIVSLFWGIGMAIHTIKHLTWMNEHKADFLSSETRLRLEGKESSMKLLDPAGSSSKGAAGRQDPLLLQCEAAAAQTRERLSGLGAGEVEALAVVDEGLDRVREMLGYKEEVLAALADARADHLEEERQRLIGRLEASRDTDTRTLYQSQLEMLEARAEKAQGLRNLHERMTAYVESYLAALTNLRMDAARIKVVDLPQGAELTNVLKPVRQLEQQMEGMRAAIQEVARITR